MGVTEDESQNLDAGWDDEPVESEVDEAWDSIAPAASVASPSSMAPASSIAPVTAEVDEGWDDAPSPAAAPPTEGKRRPHRQRRAKAVAAAPGAPVLLPKPAERNKKEQRLHARKQRAHEAQVKQQRKAERKAERRADAQRAAAERLRRAEEQEQARRARQEERERARTEREATKPRAADPKPKVGKPKAPAAAPKSPSSPQSGPAKRSPRLGAIVTLLVLALALGFLLLKK